nr:hypothetical protein CPGR_00666 [Mycolicibacterium fortuitum subsp. fortuitum DSM 46621 = ATCC 6841 = JCM 6387]
MLGRVEQIERRKPLRGIGGHGSQHTLPAGDQCLDAVRVEHIGAELDRTADPGGFTV